MCGQCQVSRDGALPWWHRPALGLAVPMSLPTGAPVGWSEGGFGRVRGGWGCLPTCSWSPRPLIKLHIIWKKDGVPLSSGISDYSRRLTILHPALSDSGYYECEAVLRSSSVPAVAEGAFLSVLGRAWPGSPSPHVS